MAGDSGFLRLLFAFWLRRRGRGGESTEDNFMETEDAIAEAEVGGEVEEDEGIDLMAVAEDDPAKGRRGKKKFWGPYGDINDPKCMKRRGEIGEAMFLAKAARMGFGIATPWGDSLKYDMVIDTGRRLFRVQVTSAHKVSANKGGGYHLRACSHNRRAYTAKDIDLLVGYVLPVDAWYLFPPRAFVRMKSMRLFPVPGRKKSKFEDYREAWECFDEGPAGW
jgi:PD-(D/E)XK endonuclease